MGLDNKDKKILALLAGNSRMPYTQLAKKARLERNVVKYRINRLIKSGVIRSFETELDYQKLGYTRYLCYFGFFKFDNASKKKVIDYFKNNDFVHWVGESIGKYQIKARICAVDEEQLYDILSDIEENCGMPIRTKTILRITGIIKQKNESIFATAPSKNAAKSRKSYLDKKDYLILQKLCENSRETLLNIHEVTGLSVEAIRKRIKKLEKTGIIRGYTVNVNHKALGIVVWGNLLIKFKDPKKVCSKLKEFALQRGCIGRSFTLFGEWNVELGFSAQNIDVLHELIGDFLASFSKEIVDYEMIFNQEGHKYPPIPKGVFIKEIK